MNDLFLTLKKAIKHQSYDLVDNTLTLKLETLSSRNHGLEGHSLVSDSELDDFYHQAVKKQSPILDKIDTIITEFGDPKYLLDFYLNEDDLSLYLTIQVFF